MAMLLIVTAFLAAGTICAQLPDPPQVKIWVVVVWVAIFCVNIVSLSARAQTHDEVNRARWVVGLSILATFLPLAILYLATALVVQTAVFLLIVGLGAVTAIIAEANFTRRDKW
ncbi:MAG: hypothetical protein J6Y91_04555, partial [Alphaproteobacteria bacterium]|nr:hypothetical protein [Alphaproteobacteria bacterium]